MKIQGVVQSGHKRGKKLGFPTINTPLSVVLSEGIYISHTKIHDKKYQSLTFIGSAKTFDETVYQAETYIFDFDQDVYGQEVEIELVKKIRDNQKFDSEAALIAQMEEDKKQAEAYFLHTK